MNNTKIKSTTSKNIKFKKLNCHPKNRTKKYTCYDDNTLIMFKNLWNKKYTSNQIVSTDVMDIWKDLQQKIPTCSDEKCWSEQLNVQTNAFSPKSPKDWETNKWLSNFDIEAVLKQYKEAYPNFDYLGPSPIDFDEILGSSCVEEKLCKLNIADKIKNKINEKNNFLNTKIKEISKLKINNEYLDGIAKEYNLYHNNIINNILKQIDLLKILLQTLEENSINLNLSSYKKREIEKDKKNIIYNISKLEKQLF